MQGLCLGILLGAAATDACFYFLMWRTDWNLEAAKAAERVGVKREPSSDGVALNRVTSLDGVDGRLEVEDSESAGLLGNTTGGANSPHGSGQLP